MLTCGNGSTSSSGSACSLTERRTTALRTAIGIAILTGGFGAGVLAERRFDIAQTVVERLYSDDAACDQPLTPREEVDLAEVSLDGAMIALAFGQSNAANTGETRHDSVSGVFDFCGGHLYHAGDPLVGTTGDGGSVWTRLGDRLIESGAYPAVVFAPIAKSSTGIAEWAPGGGLHHRIVDAIAALRASGLEPTHLLWHQGEKDAGALDTPRVEYEAHLLAIAASIRALGVSAPLYVSVATRRAGTRGDPEIAAAQRSVVNGRDILAGPDTDQLGYGQRYDGTHFSTEGLDRAAALWFEALTR